MKLYARKLNNALGVSIIAHNLLTSLQHALNLRRMMRIDNEQIFRNQASFLAVYRPLNRCSRECLDLC
jgi:hypothetical protein